MTKYRDVIIAGFLINITSIIVPFISYRMFSWIFTLPPTTIWKWTPATPIASMPIQELFIIFFINTILAFYFAYLYKIIQSSIPGSNVKRGVIYALLLYPIGVLIPMYSLYVLLNIAFPALIYFTLESLLEYLLYGMIVGFFIKNS